MNVLRLQLNQFRNYTELDISPGSGLNILYGQNAQGKTNVLEALSLLATTRSFRAARESELILRDCDAAHIHAEIERSELGDVLLQVSVLQGDKKSVRVNGMKRARVLEILGQFNAVFFGSIDLNIVTGDPADRRHYLNVEISQISPGYVFDYGRYKRILEQRNRLLKDLRDRPRPLDESGIEAWNEQLVRYGAPIFLKRQAYIAKLGPIAGRIHGELTEGKESLDVKYLPNITLPEPDHLELPRDLDNPDRPDETSSHYGRSSADLERIAESMRKKMEMVGSDEMRRGTTLIGPQRDDLMLSIDGSEARVFGSQGQQRTLALALKLAEFELIEQFVGEPPVMLLDDVMSDLDDSRRNHLMEWVQRRCQTFLTCTNLRSFTDEILSDATIYHVTAGSMERQKRAQIVEIVDTESGDEAAEVSGLPSSLEIIKHAKRKQTGSRRQKTASTGTG